MNFLRCLLKYKWFVLTGVFIVGVVLGFRLFVPDTKRPYPLFKSKVEFKMNPENIKKVVLDNGLTVLVFKNQVTPKVLLQIAYDIGSWIENAGEKGLAHLIEHMIFKGTEKLSEGDIDSISRKYGATFNAFTSRDMTSYYFEVNKNNWKPFLPILADCMQNARFDEQHLASELVAVIQELKMYKDRYWNEMLERACEIVYPSNHPYHFRIIGFKEDLINLSAENLKHFYKKYYKPERATLFIVGDVDTDEAIKVAKESFAHIKIQNSQTEPFEEIRKERFPILSKTTATNKTTLYEDVKKEQLGFYWLIPGLKEKNDVLVSMVEFILGEGEGSRLYKRLVDEEKIAVAVAATCDHMVESGVFLILLEPIEGKIEECRKIVVEELNDIIKNGIPEEELVKIKRTRGREFFESLQSLQSFTHEWIQSYLITKDELDVFDKVSHFEQIGSHEIQDFIIKHLDPFFMNQIELLPLPEGKKEIWQKSKEDSEKLDMEILNKHPRTSKVENPTFAKTLSDPRFLSFVYPKPTFELTLDNGLNVIFLQNGQWPILSVNCQFRHAGFFAEAKEGILVDLMMGLLMEGTDGFAKEDNVDFFESSGTNYAFDSSGASVALLKVDCDTILKRFFMVLTEPKFAKKALDKMRDIAIDSYHRRKDSPADVAGRLLRNSVYPNHPYCWTFDQAIDLLKQVDSKQLKELHKKYVNPKNMILTIVGNFDPAEMQKTIKEIFGSWKGKEFTPVTYPKSEFVPKSNIDEFMLRDQIVLVLGQTSSVNIYNPDIVPLKILDFICFDSLGSRLYSLREQSGLFYNAFGMFAAGATREHGFDYIVSILSLNNIDQAEKLLRGVVNEVGKNGVMQDELDAAKQLYLKALIDLTATNDSISLMLGRLKSLELGFDYYDKVLNRVQNLKLEEMNKIAAKYFVADNMSRIRVGRVGQK